MAYKTLFFDLDHTLWDYDRNSRETLEEVFTRYEIGNYNQLTFDQFYTGFQMVNYKLWADYDYGLIDKDIIRKERFAMIFTHLGIPLKDESGAISEYYLNVCPTKGHVLPYAHEVLQYLNNKYQLALITNGFTEVQEQKIICSGLKDFFPVMITSETTGFKKPAPEIFDYAMQCCGCHSPEALMIGDNLGTDILGAQKAGLDQVFYNPHLKSHDKKVTFEIACLSELKAML